MKMWSFLLLAANLSATYASTFAVSASSAMTPFVVFLSCASSFVSLAAMGVNIAILIFLLKFNKRKYKKPKSDTVESESAESDSASDEISIEETESEEESGEEESEESSDESLETETDDESIDAK